MTISHVPRRLVLSAGLVVLLAGCTGVATSPSGSVATPSTSASATAPSSAAATGSAPTGLVCTAPASPTLAVTEGPYYKAGAPESTDLVQPGMAGTRLTLTGYVMTTACAPVANAKVEIWQADASGAYDNNGYTLRGYVLTDGQGRFTIQTVVPGEYPGRTEHIHVKVTPPGGTTLTTQLFFPGTTANDDDAIYDPSLLLAISEQGSGLVGTFTFVVPA
ncbi:MAG TPA: dioxygenase [Candidatus Dormibacteraeota bacterium]|nr:dioxygenase [Candidatus Dormibacteraeota bacterium]